LNLRPGNNRPACAHSAAHCLAQPRNAAEVVAYVTRWFNRLRGSAVALVLSGQSAAGAVWQVLLQIGSDRYGWRRAILLYGILIAITVPVLAWLACSVTPARRRHRVRHGLTRLVVPAAKPRICGERL
jgi:MFS family permease